MFTLTFVFLSLARRVGGWLDRLNKVLHSIINRSSEMVVKMINKLTVLYGLAGPDQPTRGPWAKIGLCQGLLHYDK